MVNEDTVYFTSDLEKNWKKPRATTKIFKLLVTEIESTRTKRVHSVWKGYGYGVLTGVAVGTIGALVLEASGDEFAILAVPFGGFIGSGIGLISGGMPDRMFSINGSKDLLKTYFPDLDKRAFWSQLKYNRKVSAKISFL